MASDGTLTKEGGKSTRKGAQLQRAGIFDLMDDSISRRRHDDKQDMHGQEARRDKNFQKVLSAPPRADAVSASTSALLEEFKSLNEKFLHRNAASSEAARDALVKIGILGKDGELSPNLR